MSFTNSIAARGYAATRPATAPDPDSAGSVLRDAAKDFAATMQHSENIAVQSMTGGADPHALVEALAQTELAVETAVSIRDKVVAAYKEILQMPV